MKRLLTSAAMFLCCMATSFAQFTGSGSGTENDPYLILNPIQLNQLRNFLNQEGVYFKLMADIDLTEFLEDENPDQGWQPVGTSSAPFKGILDGNGKKITGLWIKRSSLDYVGLFGYISNATIKNLNISNASYEGHDNVGSVVGYSTSSIVSGCIINCKVNGNNYIGGLIGKGDNSSASDNTLDTQVKGNGDYIGGIFGYVKGDKGIIQNCKLVEGKVVGHNYVGGVCGSCCLKTTITGCYVYADIVGSSSIGGILGYVSFYGMTTYSTDWVYLYETKLNSCGFVGNISGDSYVGGIVGQYYRRSIKPSSEQERFSSQTLTRCYALGVIKATGDYIGGVIGDVRTILSISDCYYNGIISGRNNVGGIAGYNYSQIQRSYSLASINGTRTVGGLAGSNKGNISSSIANNVNIKALEDNVGRVYGYSESGSVGNMGSQAENKALNRTIVIKAGVSQDVADDEQNGTSVSATTLKLKATYVAMGWDFTNTWEIQETECYPYMKSQTAPPVITSQLVSGATSISGKCVDGGTVTLEIDGVKQQMVSTGHEFSFTVSPLQAGHEVRVSAKADGKEQSYFTTEVVSFLGKGTEADPYQISTAADLTQVYRKGYYKLMNDIDLTSYINQFSPTEGWQSIGRDGSETIHFDGNGHKITGLWCNSTRDNTGLFSCFANGTIKNLTVEVASGKQVKGGSNTGILIGKMINGTIENCKVSGKVADGTPVGGMVGLFDGGEILKCQASVTINTTASTTYAGGLVGEITGGEIDQCYTDGSLTATGDESYAGGLVGKNSGTITNCYSSAVVTSSYNAAGLVAYNFGVVDKCMVSGNLYSNNYAAGVIGYNDGAAAVISNSVALNNIIDVKYESQQEQQGGGYGQRIIGGIKNGAPAPEMNNYALSTMQVSLNDVPQKVYDDIMNGTAKTNAELKQKATYQTIGWDFDNIWNIDEGTSYPYQTIKINSGSDPNDPNDPDGPDNPDEPQGKVDVTDVSQIANVIYMEPREETKGTEVTVPVLMKNTAAIRGFQFDLYLPAGVTVAKGSNGRYVASLSSGRLPEGSAHTLTVSQQDDGAIRFLCGSQYDETFTGTEGEVATIKLCFDESMEDGQYPIVLKNVKLTETNINNFYQTETVQTALTIVSYTPGDISGDGVIDVSDYIGVANYILGEQQDGIIPAAADVNKDQVVDVSDYIGVANLILYNSIYGQTQAAARGKMNRSIANTDISDIDNVLYIEPIETTSDTELQLSLKMKNTAQIRGFQVDMYLPEGVTAVKNNNGRIVAGLNAARLPDGSAHTLTVSERPDGAIRLLCGSQYDETFTGNDGEIATLTINVGENVEAGNYPLTLGYVKLTETDIKQSYLTGEVASSFMVLGEPNSITSARYANETDDYYDLQGRRVTPVKKGIYIRNGQKVIVK